MKINSILFLIGLFLGSLLTGMAAPWQQKILLLAWGIYLFVTSYSDFTTKTVYRLYNYIGLALGAAYMVAFGNATMETFMSMATFILLQVMLFRRFMGTADSFAFVVSALFLAQPSIFPSGLLLFLVHMLLAVLLMLLGHLRDMDWKKLKLREEQPMVPYISLAAILLAWFIK